MYDNILLPYDGSEGASEVLHHASEIAHWADATIQVLYVADTTRHSVTVVEDGTVDVLERKGEEIVEEAAEILQTLGVSYETDVLQGNPAPGIGAYAERYDLVLIVMPTHGREGISRHLIGSVSEKVVRLSSVPVLTVRMQPDESMEFPYENVLIPTDGSATAMHAAEHMLSLAASLDATVHVLGVVEEGPFGLDVGSALSEEEDESEATEAVEAVVSAAQTSGVTETVSHVEKGTPIEEILECIESNNIHVVGMGTTGKRDTDGILLGGVAEKTVRSAPVPVMTVAKPN